MRRFFTGKHLAQYANSRDNNFNLIRFVAAVLVLYTHSFALTTGQPDAEPLRLNLGMTWGTIAVDVFFITSGFLIAGSYFRQRHLIAFAWARFLRIAPALVVAMVFCVFGVGLYFTTTPRLEYLTDFTTTKFFLRNVTLFLGVAYRLPGVFADLPFPGAVNGSLWTLPHEIHMYTYLAIIGTGLTRWWPHLSRKTMAILFAAIAAGALGLNLANHSLMFAAPEGTHLFAMFFVGVAYYMGRDFVPLVPAVFVGCAVGLGLSLQSREAFFVVYTLVLAYLIFFLAYVPGGLVRAFNGLGDYSYGIYIYAFPVQQSLIALNPGITMPQLMITATAVTLGIAFMSWHLVEKKMLRLKKKYLLQESLSQRR